MTKAAKRAEPARETQLDIVDAVNAAVAASAPAVETPSAQVAVAPWSLAIEGDYVVKGKRVVRLTMADISFRDYSAIVGDAQITTQAAIAVQSGGKDETAVSNSDRAKLFFRSLQRERLKRRMRAWDEQGGAIILTEADIRMLPRRYAGAVLLAANDQGDGVPGEILRQGDGILVPVHYRFGTPLKVASQGGGSEVIEEIEFLAPTLGDVEDVHAEPTPYLQAYALIRDCARPVGAMDLMRLPSWAVEQVSIADGMRITEEILPRFLD